MSHMHLDQLLKLQKKEEKINDRAEIICNKTPAGTELVKQSLLALHMAPGFEKEKHDHFVTKTQSSHSDERKNRNEEAKHPEKAKYTKICVIL